LVFKGDIVVDALRRIAHLDVAGLMDPAVPGPSEGYRTTVHLGVDAAGRPSYRRRRGHELVAVQGCAVAHPRLRELIDRVRVPGATTVTLRVGVGGGERLVVLDAAGTSSDRRGRRRPADSPAGVEAQVPPDVTVVGAGEDGAFHEAVGGRRWRVSARSFFQAGPAGAEVLLGVVDDAVGVMRPGERLADLYAGVGVLGGVVAARRPGVSLTSVESDPSAGRDARHNLSSGQAVVVVDEVGRWTPAPADVVVADPARPGLGRPGVGAVAATGARRLVLVSCDPASLARDTVLLAREGYRLERVRVCDLFAQTPHVETVSTFGRRIDGLVGSP
jgi:23S rRNA (uracil1939-C5)-methyltransferase